jgi:hypothetical protein
MTNDAPIGLLMTAGLSCVQHVQLLWCAAQLFARLAGATVMHFCIANAFTVLHSACQHWFSPAFWTGAGHLKDIPSHSVTE